MPMELERAAKNHFTISMRTADFELILKPSGKVELTAEFSHSWQPHFVLCDDMFEALSRVADYYDKGHLTNPKGKREWSKQK